MHKLIKFVGLLLCASVSVDCAKIVRVETETYSTHIRDFKQAQVSSPKVYLHASRTKNVIQVAAFTESFCSEDTFRVSLDQKVSEREQEWVLFQSLVSLGLLGGAAIVAERGSHLPDDEDAAAVATPQDEAYGWATLLALGGVYLGGDALVVGLQAIDQNEGPPKETTTRVDYGAKTPCNREPLANADIGLVHNGRELAEIKTGAKGELEIDLMEHLGLCYKTKFLQFRIGDSISEGIDVSDCALAYDVYLSIQSAENSEIDMDSLQELVSLRQDIERLPVSFQGRFHEQLDAIETRRTAALKVREAELMKDCEEAISSQIIGDASEWCTEDLFRIKIYLQEDAARFVGRIQREMFTIVDARMTITGTIGAGIPELERCLNEGVCWEWWDHDVFLEQWKDEESKVVGEIETRIEAAEKSARVLLKKPTIETLKDASNAYYEVDFMHVMWCPAEARFREIGTACAKLEASLAEWNFTQAQVADKLNKLTSAENARFWRSKFKQCKKLKAGVDALNSIGRCDAACKQTVAKMRKDLDALVQLKSPHQHWETQELQTIRQECVDAGCPRCPSKEDTYGY